MNSELTIDQVKTILQREFPYYTIQVSNEGLGHIYTIICPHGATTIQYRMTHYEIESYYNNDIKFFKEYIITSFKNKILESLLGDYIDDGSNFVLSTFIEKDNPIILLHPEQYGQLLKNKEFAIKLPLKRGKSITTKSLTWKQRLSDNK